MPQPLQPRIAKSIRTCLIYIYIYNILSNHHFILILIKTIKVYLGKKFKRQFIVAYRKLKLKERKKKRKNREVS